MKLSFVPENSDVFIQFWVWNPDVAELHFHGDGDKEYYPEHMRLPSFFLVLIQRIMQLESSKEEKSIPEERKQIVKLEWLELNLFNKQ